MTQIDYGARAPRADYAGSASAQSGSRNFLQQVEDAVRENPLPAALIGMGFFWMFMGGSRTSLFGEHRSKPDFGSPGRWGEGSSGGWGEAAYDVARRGGSSVVRQAGDALSGVGARVGEATGMAAGAAADGLSAAGSTIAGAASSAYEAIGSAGAQALDAVSNSAASAGRGVQRGASEWSSQAQTSMADLFDRHPLVLGAVGLAIGAGIAATLPVSETETRLMGDASDSLREKVQDFVSDKAEQAKTVAERTLQEVKSQGLTPAAAGDAVRGLGDKVVGVAEAVGQSLKEQVQGSGPGAAGQSKAPAATPEWPR